LKTVRARELFVQGLGRVREEMGFRLVTKGVPPAVCVAPLALWCRVSCDPALTRWANVWRTSGALNYRGCGGEKKQNH